MTGFGLLRHDSLLLPEAVAVPDTTMGVSLQSSRRKE
jgi:hypothetical protein